MTISKEIKKDWLTQWENDQDEKIDNRCVDKQCVKECPILLYSSQLLKVLNDEINKGAITKDDFINRVVNSLFNTRL